MVLGLLGCTLFGCAARPPTGGGDEPLRVELQGQGEPVSLTGELVLRFSAALHEGSVSTGAVYLVADELGEPCTVDLACAQWGGRCLHGVCQRERVDDAFVRDAGKPPLSSSRAAHVWPLRLSLSEDGRQLRVAPRVALDAQRGHTLLVTAGLRDLSRRSLATFRARVISGDGSRARPTMAMLSPPAAATDLPRNLARVVVGFSRPVVGLAPGRLRLRVAGSGAVLTLLPRLDDARCARGGCVVFDVGGALPKLAELSLEAVAGISDAAGRPLFAGDTPRLASGADVDRAPPQLSAVRALVADGCLVVRARSDEPSDALLELAGWGETRRAATIDRLSHELAISLGPDTRATAALSLRDLAGNEARRELSLVAPRDVPTVVISEVLANPRGVEPAQELVELFNRGPVAVKLGGFSIDDGDDGQGRRVLPDATLAPGGRAVIVGASWRATSVHDVAPREGTLLLRLDGPIGALGLSNGGESLVLRDAAGRAVSSYGGHHSTAARELEGASVERVDLAGCDVAGNWRVNAARTSTPGW